MRILVHLATAGIPIARQSNENSNSTYVGADSCARFEARFSRDPVQSITRRNQPSPAAYGYGYLTSFAE